MRLYRFSPIETKEQLFEVIEYIHFACHELCDKSFGYVGKRTMTKKVHIKLSEEASNL